MQRQDLEEECKAILENTLEVIQTLEKTPLEQLNYKLNKSSWSALECVDHLNQYAQFYLPEIEKQINNSTHQSTNIFKSGVLGNYFVNAMRIKNGAVKKMKSPKDKLPNKIAFDQKTLLQFRNDILQTQELLIRSSRVDLTLTKTSISLTPLIKLRLGDTLRFYVLHIERHTWQAKNTLELVVSL